MNDVLQTGLESLGVNEIDLVETQGIVADCMEYITSSEHLSPERWSNLSAEGKLNQMEITSSKYAEVRGAIPLGVSQFTPGEDIPAKMKDVAVLFNGREILVNNNILSEKEFSPSQATAAIIQSYTNAKNVSFGGLGRLEGIADQQRGGTCWLEACENFIQTHAPFRVDNIFSDRIYDQVVSNPERYHAFLTPSVLEGKMPKYPQEVLNIPHEAYPQLIYDVSGVKSSWQDFSHENLCSALVDNKGVLFVGDAEPLNKAYAGAKNAHAFFISDFRDGKYIGIDSNFPAQESQWTPEQLEASLKIFGDKPKMLVPDGESTWAYKTDTLSELGKHLDKLVAADIVSNDLENLKPSVDDIAQMETVSKDLGNKRSNSVSFGGCWSCANKCLNSCFGTCSSSCSGSCRGSKH